MKVYLFLILILLLNPVIGYSMNPLSKVLCMARIKLKNKPHTLKKIANEEEKFVESIKDLSIEEKLALFWQDKNNKFLTGSSSGASKGTRFYRKSKIAARRQTWNKELKMLSLPEYAVQYWKETRNQPGILKKLKRIFVNNHDPARLTKESPTGLFISRDPDDVYQGGLDALNLPRIGYEKANIFFSRRILYTEDQMLHPLNLLRKSSERALLKEGEHFTPFTRYSALIIAYPLYGPYTIEAGLNYITMQIEKYKRKKFYLERIENEFIFKPVKDQLSLNENKKEAEKYTEDQALNDAFMIDQSHKELNRIIAEGKYNIEANDSKKTIREKKRNRLNYIFNNRKLASLVIPLNQYFAPKKRIPIEQLQKAQTPADWEGVINKWTEKISRKDIELWNNLLDYTEIQQTLSNDVPAWFKDDFDHQSMEKYKTADIYNYYKAFMKEPYFKDLKKFREEGKLTDKEFDYRVQENIFWRIKKIHWHFSAYDRAKWRDPSREPSFRIKDIEALHKEEIEENYKEQQRRKAK